MPYLIVEYAFEPPITDEELDAKSAKLSPCFKARDVKWVKSYVSNDRTRGICIFEAADAETVRASYRSANVKFERVWSGFAPY